MKKKKLWVNDPILIIPAMFLAGFLFCFIALYSYMDAKANSNLKAYSDLLTYRENVANNAMKFIEHEKSNCFLIGIRREQLCERSRKHKLSVDFCGPDTWPEYVEWLDKTVAEIK